MSFLTILSTVIYVVTIITCLATWIVTRKSPASLKSRSILQCILLPFVALPFIFYWLLFRDCCKKTAQAKTQAITDTEAFCQISLSILTAVILTFTTQFSCFIVWGIAKPSEDAIHIMDLFSLMPLTIWSIRWSKAISRPIVRFLNLLKNSWEILYDPEESSIRTGASAKSGSPQPDKSKTSSEVSSSIPNSTPYPHASEDIWIKEPTTSQAEGGGVDDNTRLNTSHVDLLGLRNDKTSMVVNSEARICVQIAIKNLPCWATNLLPSLKVHLTPDKLSQMASSLGPYDLSVVSHNVLKVLDPGQSGILSHILKCSHVPPMEQEAEVTAILCLPHPPFILNEINNEKWLAVKRQLVLAIEIGHRNFYNIASGRQKAIA